MGDDVTNSCAIAGLAFAIEKVAGATGAVFTDGHARPRGGR
jgi:hypothetical protein